MLERVMKAGLIVAAAGAALFSLSSCGRQRLPALPPGQERVFAKLAPAPTTTGSTPAPASAELVTHDEAVRRDTVQRLARAFEAATSTDDRLDLLDKVTQLKGRAPELVPHVARNLTDPDPDIRIFAVRARAAISPGDAIPDLSLALRDRDPKVRQEAVNSFGLLPDPVPFDPLFALLEVEREPNVQQATMLLIAQRAPESLLPKVMEAVRSIDLRAVSPVIEYLRKYPGSAKSHADALAYFLDRDDGNLRLQVATVLGEWQVRSKPALAGLVRALNDEEQAVRRAAFNALKPVSKNESGYSPDASAEDRSAAVARFREWLASYGG